MAEGDRQGGSRNRAEPFRLNMEYLLSVVLAWMVPGLGHWLMGWRIRGAILGILLLGTFWSGEFLSGGYAVTRKEHHIFFYGQVGSGLSAVLADWIQWADVAPAPGAAMVAKPIDLKIPPHLAAGILLTSVAGLLNMLLVLSVMDPHTWQRRPAALGAAQDSGRAGA